ncbi:MAG: hypothetical protein AB7U45_16770, partial [Desulfamplus sp.]
MSNIVLEEKVNYLEIVLDGFMASTNAMMSRMERDTERFKKSVEQTIQDMKQENEKLGRRL